MGHWHRDWLVGGHLRGLEETVDEHLKDSEENAIWRREKRRLGPLSCSLATLSPVVLWKIETVLTEPVNLVGENSGEILEKANCPFLTACKKI